jgi:hypothetical protein
MKFQLASCLFTIQCCLLLTHASYSQNLVAQDSVKLKRLYVEFGFDPVYFNPVVGGSSNISLISEVSKDWVIGFRYYGSIWADPSYPGPPNAVLYFGPTHFMDEYNVSVGKAFQFKKWLNLVITTGPSYIKYTRPENIREVYYGGTWSYTSIEYNNVDYKLFGWGSRIDFNLLARHVAGLNVGAFWDFNSAQSIGGININLLFGKINTCKWRRVFSAWKRKNGGPQ